MYKIAFFLALTLLISSCFNDDTKVYSFKETTVEVKNQKDTITVGDTIWFSCTTEPSFSVNKKDYEIEDFNFSLMIKKFQGTDALLNYDTTLPKNHLFECLPVFIKEDQIMMYGSNSIYIQSIGGLAKLKSDKLYAELAFVAKDTGSFIFEPIAIDIVYKKFVNKEYVLKMKYTFNIQSDHKLNSKVIHKQELINKYYTVIVKNKNI